MASNKINMPSSGAGITQYFSEYKSKLTLKPAHVIALILIIIVIQIMILALIKL